MPPLIVFALGVMGAAVLAGMRKRSNAARR